MEILVLFYKNITKEELAGLLSAKLQQSEGFFLRQVFALEKEELKGKLCHRIIKRDDFCEKARPLLNVGWRTDKEELIFQIDARDGRLYRFIEKKEELLCT